MKKARYRFCHFFAFMKSSFQFGGNAVLMRELRASLRSARPFALVALYVAVLGAITVAQFPANQQISIERTPGGETPGKQLYWTFVSMQALLVLLILPAIAAGALSQEREQRTLEPLLLTPLTPLQIVWGKAVGVLSLAGLLLLSTLPLTSLCFLLGGVSPGELIAAYSVLMGLAVFTTSIGLFCSAKWTNTVKATIICYALLPIFLAFMVLFSGIGIVVAAVALLGMVVFAVIRLWREWGEKPVGESTLAHRLGALWMLLLWAGLPLMVVLLMYFVLADQDKGSVVFGLCGVVYLIFISQTGLQQAAREIVRAPEPATPSRQKVQDMQDEWRQAMAVSATPAAREGEATAGQSTLPPARASKSRDSYGVTPFLSDRLNPIFAKDMRSGLLGKFLYLVRFAYIAVIGSELLLIFLALAMPAQSLADEWTWFSGWAKLHLIILIVTGAWLGARSIAPEHEQQTLAQLVMTPLTSGQIVWGKIAAVMTYTAYVFLLGMPMALLLAGVDIVSWRGAFSFLLVEIVFGALAAAWGLYCSLKLVTVRRALGVALGGAFCLIVSALLFNNLVLSGFRILAGYDLVSQNAARLVGALLSPLQLLDVVLAPGSPGAGATATPPWVGVALPAALLLYGAVTVLLLVFTTRGFGKYADTA